MEAEASGTFAEPEIRSETSFAERNRIEHQIRDGSFVLVDRSTGAPRGAVKVVDMRIKVDKRKKALDEFHAKDQRSKSNPTITDGVPSLTRKGSWLSRLSVIRAASMTDAVLAESNPRRASWFHGSNPRRASFASTQSLKSECSGESKQSSKSAPLQSAPEHTDQNSDLQRALQEVQMWSIVNKHENVVELLETSLDTDMFYMVMEECRLSVQDLLVDFTPAAEHDAGVLLAHLFRGMLCGLNHVHRMDVVHRDVKLSNFLLGGEDGCTVKICDFSLACKVPPNEELLYRVCGTTPFMSPEMISGEGYRQCTDIWSLGASAYTLLYREFPYTPQQGQSAEAHSEAIVNCAEPTFLPQFEDVAKCKANVRHMVQTRCNSICEMELHLNFDDESVGFTFRQGRPVSPPGSSGDIFCAQVSPGIEDAFVVKRVLKGSWADTNEILAGDVLRSLDGQDVQGLSFETVNALLQKRPLKMRLSRASGDAPMATLSARFVRSLLEPSVQVRCSAAEALQLPFLHHQSGIEKTLPNWFHQVDSDSVKAEGSTRYPSSLSGMKSPASAPCDGYLSDVDDGFDAPGEGRPDWRLLPQRQDWEPVWRFRRPAERDPDPQNLFEDIQAMAGRMLPQISMCSS